MTRKKTIRSFLFLLTIAVLSVFLPVFCKTAEAKSAPKVRYSKTENSYYLYNSSNKRVKNPGIYSIRQTSNRKKFDGLYYVYATGKICTKATIHYIDTKKIGGKEYLQGFYYFGKGGKLPSKPGVVYRKNFRVNNRTFNGYYSYSVIGRIFYTEFGIVSIHCKASNGKRFDGYYYREAMSRLCLKSGIHKITRDNGVNIKYHGYRYFDKNGRMCTDKKVRKLNLTYNGTKYKGYYCFCGTDGKMIRKKGLVTLDNDVYYYVQDSTGKCFTGGKKKIGGFSYTFQANGRGKRTNTKLGSLKNS